MLATVFLLPVGFALVVRHAYRAERARAERGEAFRPEGKLRWEDAEP
jgi:hypothetical protein